MAMNDGEDILDYGDGGGDYGGGSYDGGGDVVVDDGGGETTDPIIDEGGNTSGSGQLTGDTSGDDPVPFGSFTDDNGVKYYYNAEGAIFYYDKDGKLQFTGDTVPWQGGDPNSVKGTQPDPLNPNSQESWLSKFFKGIFGGGGSGSGSSGGPAGGSGSGGSGQSKQDPTKKAKPLFNVKLPSGKTFGVTGVMVVIAAVVLYVLLKGKL